MNKSLFRPQTLLLALLLLLAAPALWSCNSETPFQKTQREHAELMQRIDEDIIQNYLRRDSLLSQAVRTSSGLYHVSLANGQGTPVTAGRQVLVKYVGRFLSNGAQPGSSGYPASAGDPNFPAGSIFDNSADKRTECGCLVFTAGSGAIDGFSEGLLLMRKGDRKLLLIPSHLAYGTGGQPGGIPPDAALLFDVEILDVL